MQMDGQEMVKMHGQEMKVLGKGDGAQKMVVMWTGPESTGVRLSAGRRIGEAAKQARSRREDGGLTTSGMSGFVRGNECRTGGWEKRLGTPRASHECR